MIQILFLSLFSPLAEALPNLYMSWWAPSNGKLQKYIKTWPRRVLVVMVVWIPILITLANIIKQHVFIWLISALVFLAFGLRLYFFDRSLKQKLKKRSSMIKISKIPELLYFLVFSSIGVILYMTLKDYLWLVPVAILMIFIGASMMSTFRTGKHVNLTLDITGRLIFSTGFLLNLYNLVRATSVLG